MKCKTYLVLDGVVGLGFACFLLLAAHVQVLHVGGEGGRDGDTGQDAHDGGKHQHQTHHHTL